MSRTLILFASLICLVAWAAAPPLPQDTPDFSGSWILDTARSSSGDGARALTVTMHLVSTNVRGEPMRPFFKNMDVRREFANRTSVETYLLGVIGGSVSGYGSTLSTTHHRAIWEQQTLVIEADSQTGPDRESGPWTEHREVWSFDSERRLRVQITDKSSSGPPVAATLVYGRKPNG